MGPFNMFRKSKKVSACNFDPKGVKMSRKHNPANFAPHPRLVGFKTKATECRTRNEESQQAASGSALKS